MTESRDATGPPGDHDVVYNPDAHGVLLNWHEHLRILLLRGRVKDRLGLQDCATEEAP